MARGTKAVRTLPSVTKPAEMQNTNSRHQSRWRIFLLPVSARLSFEKFYTAKNKDFYLIKIFGGGR
jgi:hypothetical protein